MWYFTTQNAIHFTLIAFRLISSPPLTDCFQSPKHRRSIAFLANFYHCSHDYGSSKLANYMHPPTSRCLPAHEYLLTLTPHSNPSLTTTAAVV